MLCKLFDLPLYRPETYHPNSSGGSGNGGGTSGNGGFGVALGVTMKEDDTLSLVCFCLEALENILKKSMTIKVMTPLDSAELHIPSLLSLCFVPSYYIDSSLPSPFFSM